MAWKRFVWQMFKTGSIILVSGSITLQLSSEAVAVDVVKTVVPTGSSPTWTYQHKEYVSSLAKTHVGVDIFGADTTKGGDPVYPFADGVIEDTCSGVYTATGCSPDFGNAIMIKHPSLGRGATDLYSIYLHLQDAPSFSKGYQVVGGVTQIGKVGNTGASNGYYHTHSEIRYFSACLHR